MVPAFAIVFFLSFQVLEIPLAYYSEFVLPHQYDQSNQTLAGWVKDQALVVGPDRIIGLPVPGNRLLAPARDRVCLVVVGSRQVCLFVVLISGLAPVVIMPLFNKFVPLGPEHADLIRASDALAERSGTRMSGVSALT